MFNLNDILQNAQGGNVVGNLAEQFGISPAQAQNALQGLIPALSTALQNKAGDPGALGSVISAINDKDHQDSFADNGQPPSPAAIQKSNDVLGGLFGSSNVTGQIAQQISGVTGLSPNMIEQLLPSVASIALGGMAKAMQNQGFGSVLGQWANAAQQGGLGNVLNGQQNPADNASDGSSGGGLMGVVTSVLGGLFGGGGAQQQPGGAQSTQQSGLQSLTNMFQPGDHGGDFDRDSLQNEIGQILGGKR